MSSLLIATKPKPIGAPRDDGYHDIDMAGMGMLSVVSCYLLVQGKKDQSDHLGHVEANVMVPGGSFRMFSSGT